MRGELQLKTEQDLTLRDSVYETLRNGILRGYFEPGEHLTEVNLAELLGVSRTPIREALQNLERDRLVTILPRRGAVVDGIRKEIMQDDLEIRTALEILAVRKACERITAEQMDALEEAIKAFARACGSGSIEEIIKADEDFHRILSEASGNRRLIYLMDQAKDEGYRYRRKILADPKEHPRLVREHEEILEAVKKSDAGEAMEVMNNHISRQYNKILQYLETEERK